MARSKEYLLKEAGELGVILDGSETIAQIMDKLMVIKAPEGYIKDQVATMSGQDAKKFLDYSLKKPWDTPELKERFFENEAFIAELKLDGVRMKGHIKGNEWRFDTRARSDVDYIYTENTENFPHFNESTADLREFEDTILDGEFLMPVDSIDTSVVDGKGTITKGTLTTTMAVVGSGADKAIPLQVKYGWCEYHLFDVIKYKGYWVTDFPWYERRRILEGIYSKLKESNPYLKITTVMTSSYQIIEDLYLDGITVSEKVDSLMETFENITNRGGEGLMFKTILGKYGVGKKSKEMWKLKKFESFEGFITGYIAGSHAFTGLVGSLLVSVYLPDGSIHEIAAVSQMPYDLRCALSDEDGSLKKEYYNLVIEVKGQELTKNNRYRHAVLFRWRPDRSPDTCTFEL